jgi:hypothetical protein
MRLTRRAICLCVTALTAMAILIPAHAAQAAPRPQTPVLHTSASPMAVALTDDQARAAGLSLTGSTTLRLPTGGRVLVTPGERTGTTDLKAKRRWFGVVVFFNRSETYRIGLGASVCTAVVALVPEVGVVLAGYCGILSVYARHLDHGHTCLRATVFWGSVAPLWTSHRGRYCR